MSFRVVRIAASVALVLIALYCGLWFFSSSSLACVECNCSYSLFAVNARCRQPYLAALLAVVSLVLSVVVAVVGNRPTK
jgi:hypothetical protein